MNSMYNPAPPPKAYPEFLPGEYTIKWGDITYPGFANKNKEWCCLWYGITYRGYWSWDSDKRTLRILEAPEGTVGTLENFIVLDRKMEGILSGRKISFKRKSSY